MSTVIHDVQRIERNPKNQGINPCLPEASVKLNAEAGLRDDPSRSVVPPREIEYTQPISKTGERVDVTPVHPAESDKPRPADAFHVVDALTNVTPESDTDLKSFPDFRALKDPVNLNKSVSVRARISELGEVSVCESAAGRLNALDHVVATDVHGNSLRVQHVRGKIAVEGTEEAFRSGHEVEVGGILQLNDVQHYVLRFHSLQLLTRPTRTIGATRDEIKRAEETIATQGESIFEYIQARVIQILSIVAVEAVPRLRRSLMAVVLQAASYGRMFKASGRLYTLLIGPPGVGKGTCSNVAAILSQSERVPTTSISQAGLVGTYVRTGMNTHRMLHGALVRATHSTAILEDVQNLEGSQAKAVFGILGGLMESGRISRTLAVGISYDVETALLVDVNPRSTVHPRDFNRKIVKLEDIGIPINFLSRVDIIIELDSDFEQQMQTAQTLIDTADSTGQVEDQREDVRQLRVLVALLKERFSTISFEEVKPLVNERLKELLKENVQNLDRLQLASDFLIRGSRSLLKMIAASARLHARHVANEQDVGIAFELFAEKLEFIKKLEPAFRSVDSWKGDADGVAHRHQRIMEHFAGKSVTLDSLIQMFSNVSARTLRRDMEKLGAKLIGNSTWEVAGATIPAEEL